MCPTFKPAPSLDAPQVGLLRADSLRSRNRSAPICSSRTKPFDPSQVWVLDAERFVRHVRRMIRLADEEGLLTEEAHAVLAKRAS